MVALHTTHARTHTHTLAFCWLHLSGYCCAAGGKIGEWDVEYSGGERGAVYTRGAYIYIEV